MTDEQRVREVLRGAVDDVVVTGDGWADVEARAASRPSRGAFRAMPPFRPWVGVAVAAAVLAVVGIAVVRIADDEQGTRVVTPAESTSTSTSAPGTTPTTVPQAAPMPATFVATRDDSSKLVLVSSETGDVIRTLVDLGPMPPGTPESHGTTVIESMILSPDGRHVYYNTGPEPINGELHRVDVATGKVEDLGAGRTPALSPDGRTLARVVDPGITLTTPDGRNARTYETPTGAYGLDLEWTPDGDGLVALVSGEGDSLEWVRIDARLRGEPVRLDDGAGLVDRATDAELVGGMLAFLGPDGIAMFDLSDGFEHEFTVAVDKRVNRVRFDESGRHALLWGPGGPLYRTTLTEQHKVELVELGADFDIADW